MALSASIIGSFKQHYGEVREVLRLFMEAGIEVRSPAGSDILEPGIKFVRFQTDPPKQPDYAVQSVTLRRILLLSDFTYVVAPEGYIGNTTCYEIGRIIQAGRPLYFSSEPRDLPVRIGHLHIMSAPAIAERARLGLFVPEPLYPRGGDDLDSIERSLIYGH